MHGSQTPAAHRGHRLEAGTRWTIVARRWIAGFCVAVHATAAGAQDSCRANSCVDTATSATWVLLSGMVGGIAGFKRLEAELVDRGQRVISIDPYQLSLDSADVSFADLARRVDAVLVAQGVQSARIVGHSYGAGVALRLAAMDAKRVEALYFLDAGALPQNRSRVVSRALRLVPMVARIPGGRGLLRSKFLSGIRESAGRQEWFDASTQRSYAEPMLDSIGRVVALAIRLGRSEEPEPVEAIIARLHVPVTLVLGDAPHSSGTEPSEIAALEPLGGLLRVVRMPGVGHFPHEEAPADVARYLLAPLPARLVALEGGR